MGISRVGGEGGRGEINAKAQKGKGAKGEGEKVARGDAEGAEGAEGEKREEGFAPSGHLYSSTTFMIL